MIFNSECTRNYLSAKLCQDLLGVLTALPVLDWERLPEEMFGKEEEKGSRGQRAEKGRDGKEGRERKEEEGGDGQRRREKVG